MIATICNQAYRSVVNTMRVLAVNRCIKCIAFLLTDEDLEEQCGEIFHDLRLETIVLLNSHPNYVSVDLDFFSAFYKPMTYFICLCFYGQT